MMKDTQYYLALNYRKVVSKDEDGIFVVEVPDLPGCVADGDTVDEAFRNLTEAMEVWIASRVEAGESVPEPRVADAYSGKFVLRLPKQLHQMLAEQAETEECSLNQYVLALLSEAVGRKKELRVHADVERPLNAILDGVQRIERALEPSYIKPFQVFRSEGWQLGGNPPQDTQEGSQFTAAPFGIGVNCSVGGQTGKHEFAYEA